MPKTPPAPVLCRHCFRAGSDCGRCGKEVCRGYKPLRTPAQQERRQAAWMVLALVVFLVIGSWGLAAEGGLGVLATIVGIVGLLITGEFGRP